MEDRMTAAERRALAVLANCPTGATHDALVRNRVKPATLDQLVARGLVETRQRRFANQPGLVVAHYWITRAGLAAMERA
jgi:hypothetical protein